MKDKLFFKINDTNIIITAVRKNFHTESILFNKKYDLESINPNLPVSFGQGWIKDFKNDFLELGLDFTKMHIVISLNTRNVITKTFHKSLVAPFKNVGNFIRLLKNNVMKDEIFSNEEIIDIEITRLIQKKEENKIFFSYFVESLNKTLFNDISKIFDYNDLEVDEFISMTKLNTHGLKEQLSKESSTMVINVQNTFTSIDNYVGNYFLSNQKIDFGLKNIYREIKTRMNVSTRKAKDLFYDYGHIPPTTLTNNKIILTRKENDTIVNYTKKDLSLAISSEVDKLLEQITDLIQGKNMQESTILFVGDITLLNGLNYYLSKNNFKNATIYKKHHLIGFNFGSDHIIRGLINSNSY